MRPKELRYLEWGQLNLEGGCIVLHRHKTSKTRRDRRPRIVILHPVIVKLLTYIRRQYANSKYVFLNSRGRPWTRSAITQRMARLRERVGVDGSCKLYSARHAFATGAAMNGVDIATLAELLGHTSTAMSAYYIHVAGQKDHLRDAVLKAMR